MRLVRSPADEPMAMPTTMTAMPNQQQLAGEDVRPVADVEEVRVLDQRLVVVRPDELGAVAALERDVDGSHERDEQAAGDERQRRCHEDPRSRPLLDLAAASSPAAPPRARHAGRSGASGTTVATSAFRRCRRRTRRRPRRRRASRPATDRAALTRRRIAARAPPADHADEQTRTDPDAGTHEQLGPVEAGLPRLGDPRATSTPRPAKPATASGRRARSSRGGVDAEHHGAGGDASDQRPCPRARRRSRSRRLPSRTRKTTNPTGKPLIDENRVQRSYVKSNSLLAPTNRPARSPGRRRS